MDFIQKLWLASFLLNLHFLYAVFDIYFRSTVVQVHSEAPTVDPDNFPNLKRVIFIVADGLRADTFFDNPELHPHLLEKMNGHDSVWGISDAKVPTESRPGHVALFAGIYEDPSAVFSGWKKNLVPFDTVFDSVRFAVMLGSPDIVSIFGRRSSGIIASAYPSDWQDFLSRNSSVLDLWVEKEYSALLESGSIPHHNSVLIFLHLLGIDNTGHAAKPGSPEYMANIALVDEIIKNVENQSNSYFGDNQTLYVFTSDHGMTDHGSHGGGSTAETETPFVIWGNGIKSMNVMQRMNQVDFAALLAGALSVPYPTNSMGIFPAFWNDDGNVYATLAANLNQVEQLMLTKKKIVQHRWLRISEFDAEVEINSTKEQSDDLARRLEYDNAINILRRAIRLSIDGADYYERYDQQTLVALTISTFILWICILAVSFRLIFEGKQCNLVFRKYFFTCVITSTVLASGAFGWPVWRSLYIVVPLYLARVLISVLMQLRSPNMCAGFRLGIAGVIGVEILALSFFHREVLTLGLFMNAAWYALSRKPYWGTASLWVQCLVLGVFPLLPIPSETNNVLMCLGPVASIIIAAVLLGKTRESAPSSKENWGYALLAIQLSFLGSLPILMQYPEFIVTRCVAWTSLPMICLPVLCSFDRVTAKLFSLFLGIQLPITLLCFNYESLFLPCLFIVLLHFLQLELAFRMEFPIDFNSTTFHDLSHLKTADIDSTCRVAWLQIFFVYYSFFGMGNIASISSFNPSSSRCFLSVFNPFVMMVLLLLKIVGGFLLVSLVSQLCTRGKQEVGRKFLFLILLSQAMSMHMFVNIRNEGSWAEIGTSISHFVIVQVSTLFLLLLHHIAASLLRKSEDASKRFLLHTVGKLDKIR